MIPHKFVTGHVFGRHSFIDRAGRKEKREDGTSRISTAGKESKRKCRAYCKYTAISQLTEFLNTASEESRDVMRKNPSGGFNVGSTLFPNDYV